MFRQTPLFSLLDIRTDIKYLIPQTYHHLYLIHIKNIVAYLTKRLNLPYGILDLFTKPSDMIGVVVVFNRIHGERIAKDVVILFR